VDEKALRVGLLARVSTAKQEQYGHSLDEQLLLATEFLDDRETPYALHDPVFRTTQKGGKNKNDRRDLHQVVAAARAGLIDEVLVTDVDRMTRNVGTGWWFVETLVDELRVPLIILEMGEEPLDLTTADNRKKYGDNLHFADKEREKIARRAVRTIRKRKAQGLRHGGRRNFGFSEEDHNRRHPVEAKYIPRIFEEVDAGRGYRAIAKDIRDEGITGTHGGAFSYSNVQWIIANPIYAGYVRVWISETDYELKDVAVDKKTGEPLVDQLLPDRDLWHRVNDKRTKQIAKSGGKGGGTTAKRHLFSGTGPALTCSICGRRLMVRTQRDSYICASKETDWCGLPSVRRSHADTAIVEQLLAYALDLPASIDEMREQASHVTEVIEDDIRESERALLTNERAKRNVEKLIRLADEDADDYEDNLVEYSKMLAEIRDERAALEAELDLQRAQLASMGSTLMSDQDVQVALRWLQTLRKDIREGTADPENVEKMRALATRVIETVIVHPATVEVDDPNLAFAKYGLEIRYRRDAILDPPTGLKKHSISLDSVGSYTGEPWQGRSGLSLRSRGSTVTTAARRSSRERSATRGWRSSTPAFTRRPSRSSRR
jgi:site-specific DNA recombinase